MGQQRHHRGETDQTRSGALDGAIRPLTWGVEAQMGPALLEGRFNGPAFAELVHHRPWSIVEAGREVGSWVQAPCGIAAKLPADGQHGLAHSIPHGDPARHVQLTSTPLVPAHADAVPDRLPVLQDLL